MSDENTKKKTARQEIEAYLGEEVYLAYHLDQVPDDADWEEIREQFRPDWSKLHFADLRRAMKDYKESGDEPGPRLCSLVGRCDDIHRFLERGVWPCNLAGAAGNVAKAAIAEVLARLPEEAFDRATDHIFFIVQHPELLAVNAPFRGELPPLTSPKGRLAISLDIIALFEPCLKFEPAALVGLIAHEIAHSFVEGDNYTADEKLADELAAKWGFAQELQARTEAKNQPQTGDGVM